RRRGGRARRARPRARAARGHPPVSTFPDRGALQPERTALAWQRTGTAALVVLLPMVLTALRIEQPWLAAGGAVAAVISTGLLAAVRRRLAQLGDDERGYSPFVPMFQVGTVAVLGSVGG